MVPKQKPPKEIPPTKEELKIMKELDEELGILPEKPIPPPNLIIKEGRGVVGEIWTEYENSTVVYTRDRRLIGGVFSYLADKMGLDSSGLWILRLIGVIGMFAYGFTIPIYLIAWALKPKE